MLLHVGRCGRLLLCASVLAALALGHSVALTGEADVTVSEVHDVHYGERGGVQLWAKVQFPHSYDPHVPAPLLIVLHAWSNDTVHAAANALADYADAADARGWLLAAPLLHGHTASRVIQRDVITLVDFMADTYRADRDRIYLQGKSMGGMIAATTAARYPDVFAAVVEEHGATSLTQWYRETEDWRQDVLEEEIGGTPEDLPFEYQRCSAASMAQNLKNVPLAILHGLHDQIVPVTHAQDLYNALRLYHPRHVELHLFAGGHGESFPGDDTMAPAPDGILDFLGQYALDDNPADIAIRADETHSYYWMQVVQGNSWAPRWTRVEASLDISAQKIEATIRDERRQPCAVVFDLLKARLPIQPYMVEYYNKETGDFRWQHVTVSSSGRINVQVNAAEHEITLHPWDGHTPDVVTFQQGNAGYAGASDTFLDRWNSEENYGNRGDLAIREGMDTSLLRFDHLGLLLPEGSEVRGAQLRLYVTFGGNNAELSCYRMLRSWAESEATWRQARTDDPWAEPGAEGAGLDRESSPHGIASLRETHRWYTLNVRDLVLQWLDDPTHNYGVLLKGSGPDMYRFASSDNPWNMGLRPELRVFAVLPPATPTSTPSLTPPPTHTPTPTRTPTCSATPAVTRTATGTSVVTTPSSTPTTADIPLSGIIYGLVWEDADGDQRVAESEWPLANVRLELRDVLDAVVGMQWTPDNGRYAFTNLEPGAYRLTALVPLGYEPTTSSAWEGWLDEYALQEVNFGARLRAVSPTPQAVIRLPLTVKG